MEGYLASKYGYRGGSLSALKKLLGMLVYLRPGRQADLDFRLMYLPARPDGRLLDVGCGSGWLLKRMQDLGWRVEGVDFDPVAVENARSARLRVRLGTLEAQQYHDNHFDAITMSHLIEHVYDPLRVLCECYRILKPGGRLVVVTPNGESWGHRIFKQCWRGLEPPRHLYIFNVRSLRYLAERVGFSKFKISTTVRDANGIFIASRSIQRTGKHVMGSPQPQPWVVSICAKGVQLVEWAILKMKPNVSEEIALVAEK